MKEFILNLYGVKGTHREPLYTTEKKSNGHHQTLEEFLKDNLNIPKFSVDGHYQKPNSYDFTQMPLKLREARSKKYRVIIEEIV